jgi:hypothetical protein
MPCLPRLGESTATFQMKSQMEFKWRSNGLL